MRYIPQPEALETRAQKYMNQVVRDTQGRQGEVKRAYVNEQKQVIALWVYRQLEHDWFITDNEHATIVRTNG